MKRNLLALIIVLLVLIGLPAGLFGYQAWRTGQWAGAAGVLAAGFPAAVIDIVARSPEQGGFTPDHLVVKAGQPVRLRISSPDVVQTKQ